MLPEDHAPPATWPPRRFALWAGIAMALIVAGYTASHFGAELPDLQEAPAAAALRATNARSISILGVFDTFLATSEPIIKGASALRMRFDHSEEGNTPSP